MLEKKEIEESKTKEKLIKIRDTFYISADSSYADDRTSVLNNADTFGIFDRWGDIQPIGKEVQGLYHEGTRFISSQDFHINNERPLLLSSSIKDENEIMDIDLTNPDFYDNQEKIIIRKGTIHINKKKFIQNGICYEKIEFTNFGQKSVKINVEISFDSDFKDIFEIRGLTRLHRGKILPPSQQSGKLSLEYAGLDEQIRKTEIQFIPDPDSIFDKNVKFGFELTPKQKFEIRITLLFLINERAEKQIGYENAINQVTNRIRSTKDKIAEIITNNRHFNHWVKRSEADLISLSSCTRYGLYPYAGVPWYNTTFGRDGIITAMECLWAYPELSKGVLKYLVNTQAVTSEPFRDSEPGKIFHEYRTGEMANLNEIPFKMYYGTIDATPLFIMLAGMYYKRTADIETLSEIWPSIESALNWIDKFGDFDGDQFVEYIQKTKEGLINQGWKDSFDSVFHQNGELATAPIALSEVQGYVYSAKMNASFLASVLGYKELSEKLIREAIQLKEKFNSTFWDEELNSYILALDSEKKPCRVVTSNAGHCLFTEIADTKFAEKQAWSLMQPSMFSGWGIRTLDSSEALYNPMSYHNGSIWPHDNAIIAYGMAKYGFSENCLKIFTALYEATRFIEFQRLPELYCGFEKREGIGPIAYPVACSPQAWSVASLYLLIQSALNLEINALEKKIIFNKPQLPDFLETLELKGIQAGDEKCSFKIRRYKNEVGINVIKKSKDWEIIILK